MMTNRSPTHPYNLRSEEGFQQDMMQYGSLTNTFMQRKNFSTITNSVFHHISEDYHVTKHWERPRRRRCNEVLLSSSTRPPITRNQARACGRNNMHLHNRQVATAPSNNSIEQQQNSGEHFDFVSPLEARSTWWAPVFSYSTPVPERGGNGKPPTAHNSRSEQYLATRGGRCKTVLIQNKSIKL